MSLVDRDNVLLRLRYIMALTHLILALLYAVLLVRTGEPIETLSGVNQFIGHAYYASGAADIFVFLSIRSLAAHRSLSLKSGYTCR